MTYIKNTRIQNVFASELERMRYLEGEGEGQYIENKEYQNSF